MKMFTIFCVHAWETNTHARVTMRSVHIQVMFKVISFSIFNMHELVETCMVARVIVFEIPRLTCTVKRALFPEQMNSSFDNLSRYQWIISKFQSKLHVLETDDVKQRLCRFLFRENLLGIVFIDFVFSFASSVSGTQNKWANSHHSHPRHPFRTWIYCECNEQNGLTL